MENLLKNLFSKHIISKHIISNFIISKHITAFAALLLATTCQIAKADNGNIGSTTGNNRQYIENIDGMALMRTYYDTENHRLPDGVKAYTVTDIDWDDASDDMTATLNSVSYIPAGKGVLLIMDKESETVRNYMNENDLNNFEEITNMPLDIDNGYVPTEAQKAEAENTTSLLRAVTDGNDADSAYFYLGSRYDTEEWNDPRTDKNGNNNFIGFFTTNDAAKINGDGHNARMALSRYDITGSMVIDDKTSDGQAPGVKLNFAGSNEVTAITSAKAENGSEKDNHYYTLAGNRASDNIHGLYIHNGKVTILK